MAISLKPVDVAVIGLGAAGRHRDAASGVNLVRFEVDGRIYPGARLESGNFGGQAAHQPWVAHAARHDPSEGFQDALGGDPTLRRRFHSEKTLAGWEYYQYQCWSEK